MKKSITLEQLLEAGCHFGHQVRRWNPSMAKYIYGDKNGVHIFDLVKTKEGLDSALDFLASLAKEDKKVLLLGTKRQAADEIKKIAAETGMPYLSVRWPGGMFTNFAQLQKSVHRMVELKDKREKGELKKYTKREQLLLDREIAKLEKTFSGIASMEKLPDALFVVDTHKEEVAVREARAAKIPVIGIVDTNANPDLVDYIIPANDDADKSLSLILEAVGSALKK
jgi:small subunit ribosomal protein S2